MVWYAFNNLSFSRFVLHSSPSRKAANADFIADLISTIKAKGRTVAIYTSKSQVPPSGWARVCFCAENKDSLSPGQQLTVLTPLLAAVDSDRWRLDRRQRAGPVVC